MENTTFYLDLNTVKPPQWVVYSLHDSKGEMQYIGSCQLRSLMSIPDARKHPKFSTIFPQSKKVLVKIHKLLELKSDCTVFINNYLYVNARPFMMQYRMSHTAKVPIQCLETGEIFESIVSCANQHGVTSSALSNHLNGNPSYLKVSGRTYKHVREEEK